MFEETVLECVCDGAADCCLCGGNPVLLEGIATPTGFL